MGLSTPAVQSTFQWQNLEAMLLQVNQIKCKENSLPSLVLNANETNVH